MNKQTTIELTRDPADKDPYHKKQQKALSNSSSKDKTESEKKENLKENINKAAAIASTIDDFVRTRGKRR